MKVCTAVDLFCGIGGLTHGFIKENIPVIAGFDIDETCRYAYMTNNNTQFFCKPIEKTSANNIRKLYPKNSIKILMGCAPCQPFSSYNRGKKKEKMNLLSEFGRIIDGVEPEIVTMENVPRLTKYEVFDHFVENLKTNGFYVNYKIVYCPDYNIPQKRKRLVLLASRLGEIKLIEGEKGKCDRTVRSEIGYLEPVEAGGISELDPLHRTRNLSPLNKIRIRNTPPGGSWLDWNDDLKLKCHKKKTGKTFKSIYGRMGWDDLAPTITTQFHGYGNGRFGHPEQNRAISYREAVLLQTFPKYYEIVDPNTPFIGETTAKHIGNAVPVELGRIIAKSIRKHIVS